MKLRRLLLFLYSEVLQQYRLLKLNFVINLEIKIKYVRAFSMLCSFDDVHVFGSEIFYCKLTFFNNNSFAHLTYNPSRNTQRNNKCLMTLGMLVLTSTVGYTKYTWFLLLASNVEVSEHQEHQYINYNF